MSNFASTTSGRGETEQPPIHCRCDIAEAGATNLGAHVARRYVCVLRKVGGLCFHRSKQSVRAGAPPERRIPFEALVAARHAVGLDFYDGVIEVRRAFVACVRHSHLDDVSAIFWQVLLEAGGCERLRVGFLNHEFHSLLSALNVYMQQANDALE